MHKHPSSADEARTCEPDRIVRVYMGSPVGAPTREGVFRNWLRGLYAARLLVEEGYAVIAPHLMYLMILDEHNPKHRELGVNLDLAAMAGVQKVILFTPDGTPASATTGMKRDIQRRDELHDRWIRIAQQLDETLFSEAGNVIPRGLPIEYRAFPEVPDDWRPSFLTPTWDWIEHVNEALAAAV